MKREERDRTVKEILENCNSLFKKLGLTISKTLDERISAKTLNFEAINEDLQTYIIETFSEEKGLDRRPIYVELQGSIMRLDDISIWQKEKKYSYKSNSYEYRLVINRTENVKVPLANTIIIYSTPEDLEKAYNKIRDLKVFMYNINVVEDAE